MMYNIETLKQINPLYDSEHRVTQSDVDKANKYIEAIQNSRTDTQIQVGDIVELTTRYGDYYKNAHIDRYIKNTDEWYVCDQPYTLFVYFDDNESLICYAGGGTRRYLPNKFSLIDKRTKLFKDWGHCGACGNGTFMFEAEVNVWEYKESNPEFGDYTTKDWQKRYISYCPDKPGNPSNGILYRCFEEGITFTNKKEYETWLKKYKGVEFEGHIENQKAVFFYREKSIRISKEEWDNLDLPEDTDQYNGNRVCKIKYDDETHVIEVYWFHP